VGVIFTLRQQQWSLAAQHRQLRAERDALLEEREALKRSEKAREKADDERRTAEQVARLMPLLARWEDPDFVEARTTLENHLRGTSVGGPMLVRDYRRPSDPIGRPFHAVYRFLARLNLLIQHGLVRKEDVQNLFGGEAEKWASYLPNLSFDPHPDWQGSSPNYQEMEALHFWFKNNVDPLSERLGFPHRVPC
jgi:hypothetical protein